MIGVMYPTWNSFLAIESHSDEDDKQVSELEIGCQPGWGPAHMHMPGARPLGPSPTCSSTPTPEPHFFSPLCTPSSQWLTYW